MHDRYRLATLINDKQRLHGCNELRRRLGQLIEHRAVQTIAVPNPVLRFSDLGHAAPGERGLIVLLGRNGPHALFGLDQRPVALPVGRTLDRKFAFELLPIEVDSQAALPVIAFDDFVLRFKVTVNRDRKVLLGQVFDMPKRSLDDVLLAKIFADRFRLSRRLDDHERSCHGL